MNKNKGIKGIGLILAIVLGLAVVGGGAYYLGKSDSKQEVNKLSEVSEMNKEVGQEVSKTQEQGTKVVEQTKTVVDNSSANCTPNSVPSIKVLSPNGGEVYKAGDKITVKWESCNFRSNAKGVNISVAWVGNLEALSFPVASGTPDDGQEVITLPSLKEIKDFYTNTFKVDIQMNIVGQNLTVNGDDSDNFFTINSSEVSTTLPEYIGYSANCDSVYQINGKCWPPVIKNSTTAYSCNNIGVAPNTEGNDVTAQRAVNSKTYCIHSLSDGYTGGRGYTYTYTTANGTGTKTTTFGLTYQSCGVWQGDGTSKYSDCKNNQSNFTKNLDTLIDSLMSK